jgi:hypothetical protein
MRVFGWQTRVRNESEQMGSSTEAHHRPTLISYDGFE